jgi:dTDP-4-amino-4,6-dideoxygalactose transaminase
MKQTVSDLAIFGGIPLFAVQYHVGRPNMGDRELFIERVLDIWDRKYVTNGGPYVRAFEQRIAQLVGTRHCIATCNATAALQIVIRACELTGEVIVPSFTFIATAHAPLWQGVTPVFCDIDPHTHNIDPARIEALITPRTTAIIGVHLWGRPCAIDELARIAQRHGLRLLFDAAHAVGCAYRGRMIGSFGDAEVLSFHATKILNCFEGGAVVTNDDALAERIRLMTNFGFVDYDHVACLGTNGKMTEVAAAMGLTSLASLDRFVAVNRRNYRLYAEELADVPGVTLAYYDDGERCNFHYVVVEIDAAAAGLSRDTVQLLLQAENVLARRYFHPGCHRMEPYRSLFPDAGLLLPETERVAERVLALPTGTAVGPDEIRAICGVIRFAVSHSGSVHAAWPGRVQLPEIQALKPESIDLAGRLA